jgi:hypothetical protein
VGFDVLPPFVVYDVGASMEHRSTVLAQFRHRVAGIADDSPILFRPNSDFDAQFRLKVPQ